jgi:hypothetical protein
LKNIKEGIAVGKKHRSRINGQKKNNHIPKEALIAEETAHAKENSAKGRKNGPGYHDNPDL